MKEILKEDISRLEKMVLKADKTAVICHIHPDGDAIGSTTAFYSFARAMGKQVDLIYPHAWPSTLEFLSEGIDREHIFIEEQDSEAAVSAILKAGLIVCMDFNAFDRTGDALGKALDSSSAFKILIDHHLNPDTEKFTLVFSETEISSTAELFHHIMMKSSLVGGDVMKIPAIAARACMTGMTTDTNNFANSVYPSTFTMASDLIRAGVDRDNIIEHIFHSYREERLRLMGRLLHERLTITGTTAWMIIDAGLQQEYNIQDGDTEGFVNIPLNIGKVRLSILLKEDKDRFRVSIRSKKGTSANAMATCYFNGGGHEQASGGRIMKSSGIDTVEKAASYILKAIDSFTNTK